jgi:hypothetical protein
MSVLPLPTVTDRLELDAVQVIGYMGPAETRLDEWRLQARRGRRRRRRCARRTPPAARHLTLVPARHLVLVPNSVDALTPSD